MTPLASSVSKDVHLHQGQIVAISFVLNLGAYISLPSSISQSIADEFEGVERLLDC